MIRMADQFQDRTVPPDFADYVAGPRIAEGRVRSLWEVARLMNDSRRYETQFSASDIARIEAVALKKIKRSLRHDRPQPDHHG